LGRDTTLECVSLGQFNGGFQCGTVASSGVACVVLPTWLPSSLSSAAAASPEAVPIALIASSLRSQSAALVPLMSSPLAGAFMPIFRAGVLEIESEISDAELDMIESIEVYSQCITDDRMM
jgi:hypothetical protein